jgi:hypothetical protein
MNFKKLISAIARLFKEAKISYMLVGGFAVAYWGYPRQSLDIDIVTNLTEENLPLFLKNAKKTGFVFHSKEIKMLLTKSNRFVIELDDFRVDCWLPKTWFEKMALAEKKQGKLFGQTISIISPENLILSKLLVARARDLEDAKTVLLRQGKGINQKHLKQQALALNVGMLLKNLKGGAK